MLKLLIIDDEMPARNRLRRMLAKVPAVQLVGEAASGQEALHLIKQNKPDALLLDISMPGLSGMALAHLLRDQPTSPAVIFCTAWSDQAVEAFECEAIDYLVKPVRQQRLEEALDKASRFISQQHDASAEVFLRSTLGGKVNLLPLSDVICLHSEDKYTTAVHEKGRMMINQPLLQLEKDHADTLVRIHRGTLVARKRIRGLEKAPGGRHFLILDGSDEHPQVSRRCLPMVRKLIRKLT